METGSTSQEINPSSKAIVSSDDCIPTEGKPFCCDSCPLSFRSYRGFTQHKKLHKRETERESTLQGIDSSTKVALGKVEKPFSCDSCALNFRSIKDLIQHNKKSFSCSSGPSQNKRLHSGMAKRIFTCDVCGKCFRSSSDLLQHEKVHIGRKQYTCGICRKQFKLKPLFLKHRDSHIVVKKPSCNDWSKVFVDRLGLLKPIEIHTSDVLFSCTVCGLRFSIKSMLSSHEKVHAFEKPSHDDTEGIIQNDDDISQQQQQSAHGDEEFPLVRDDCLRSSESLGDDLSGKVEVIIKEEVDPLEELSNRVIVDPSEELPVKQEVDPLQVFIKEETDSLQFFIKEEHSPLEELAM